MNLPKRRRNAIFPGLLKELLDIVRKLNKAHGKTLPCRARCFGVMFPDVNSQIEDASPMLGLRPARNQVVLLGSEPVVFHLKELGPVQSVCLMPLGVPKKSIVLHTTSVAKEATGWEMQSSNALFLHTDTHFVLPPANSHMSHVLVTPLAAVRSCFVEEDQPWLQNHVEHPYQWCDLSHGKTISCRDVEHRQPVLIHIDFLWRPVVHCPRATRSGLHATPGKWSITTFRGAEFVVLGFIATQKSGWHIVAMCRGCMSDSLLHIPEGQVKAISASCAEAVAIGDEWRCDLHAVMFLSFCAAPCEDCCGGHGKAW